MGYAPIILLAEDNENDAALLQIALEECGVRHVLVTTEDGQDAMAYLRGDFPYTNRSLYPLPRLIILDLDMPRMSGFDVLAWLASQPDLRHLPAIVLSGSSDASNVSKARALGALDYHVKTHRMAELVQSVQSIGARWLSPGTRLGRAEKTATEFETSQALRR